MLKNIVKTCFLVLFTFIFSTAAMAEGPVIKGIFKSTFGYYAEGATGTTGFFRASGEADFRLYYPMGEKFAAAAIIGTDFYATLTTYNQQVSYKASDSLKLIVGDHKVREADMYAMYGGSIGPGPLFLGNEIKGAGFHASYRIGKSMKAQFGYMAHSPFRAPDLTGNGAGQYFVFSGRAASLDFRASMVTGTTDDYSDATDTPSSDSVMQLGAKYSISDSMSISLDYGTSSRYGTMALQLTAKQIGPGDIIFTYGNYGTSATVINLVYDKFITEGRASMQGFYLSKTTTAGTEMMAGLGMQAPF